MNDEYVEIPSNREAQQLVAQTRRKLQDLPAAPKQMNGISLVCVYSMLGLSDEEIGVALGCDPAQVGRMRMNDAYKHVMQEIVQAITENDVLEARDMLRSAQKDAVNRLRDMMMGEGVKQEVRMRAIENFLDRGGNRAVDVVEHVHKVEGGLNIRFIEEDKDDGLVEVEGIEIDGDG